MPRTSPTRSPSYRATPTVTHLLQHLLATSPIRVNSCFEQLQPWERWDCLYAIMIIKQLSTSQWYCSHLYVANMHMLFGGPLGDSKDFNLKFLSLQKLSSWSMIIVCPQSLRVKIRAEHHEPRHCLPTVQRVRLHQEEKRRGQMGKWSLKFRAESQINLGHFHIILPYY